MKKLFNEKLKHRVFHLQEKNSSYLFSTLNSPGMLCAVTNEFVDFEPGNKNLSKIYKLKNPPKHERCLASMRDRYQFDKYVGEHRIDSHNNLNNHGLYITTTSDWEYNVEFDVEYLCKKLKEFQDNDKKRQIQSLN